jgi:hypothetical protein
VANRKLIIFVELGNWLELTFYISSPAVIAPDADLQVVANRIGWGKFYNSGQVK